MIQRSALPTESQPGLADTARRSREIRGLGLQALRRVLGANSELVELWREAGEEGAWRANVEKVAATLT
jgi:hypothetical protein